MYRIKCIKASGLESTHWGDSLLSLLRLAKNDKECQTIIIEIREAGRYRPMVESDYCKAFNRKVA